MSNTMDKSLLIVVDMQNDFIDGSLGSPEAEAIVPNVQKVIQLFKDNGDDIIFTRDTHFKNYMNTSEGKSLPIQHCVKHTYGWEISDKLDTTGCRIIDKSTFGVRDWAYYGLQYKDITLVGLCTDICVVSNALILKADYPEIPIIVEANCCAGTTPGNHKAALQTMKSCQICVIE